MTLPSGWTRSARPSGQVTRRFVPHRQGRGHRAIGKPLLHQPTIRVEPLERAVQVLDLRGPIGMQGTNGPVRPVLGDLQGPFVRQGSHDAALRVPPRGTAVSGFEDGLRVETAGKTGAAGPWTVMVPGES